MPRLQFKTQDFRNLRNSLAQDNTAKTIRYAMDEIDLRLLQAKADGGGELLNPQYYSTAIGNLNTLKAGIRDEDIIQSIDEQIARYQIAQNSLLKQIGKQGVGDTDISGLGSTIPEIMDNLQVAYNQDKRKVFEANYRTPSEFVKEMQKNERQWYEDVARIAEDYRATKGKYPAQVIDFGTERFHEMQSYRGIELTDKKGRSKFGIYVKTDAYGDIDDFVIKEKNASFATGSGYKEGNFQQLGNWNIDGMPMFLQRFEEDEAGNVKAYWNGVTIESDGQQWVTPEGMNAIDMMANSNQAQNIRRPSGHFITTPDGKAYIYGGFDGVSEQWHHVTNPEITSRMRWWDKYNQTNTPVTSEEFEGLALSGLVGKPLTMGDMETDMNDLDRHLQEARDSAWLLGPGPEVAGRAVKRGVEQAGEVMGRFADVIVPEVKKRWNLAQPGQRALEVLKGVPQRKFMSVLPEATVQTGKGMWKAGKGIVQTGVGFFKGLFGK